jgi:hypothetical protein
VHPELPAADADARGHRCCDRPRALYPHALFAAAVLPVEQEQAEFSAVRSLRHRPESKQRSVQAESREPELQPAGSFPLELPLQPAHLPRLRWPRVDDAWLARLPRRLARASPRGQERRGQCHDADELQPAERQRARASHAPNGRGCAQPGRRSADSNDSAQERPSDEGD